MTLWCVCVCGVCVCVCVCVNIRTLQQCDYYLITLDVLLVTLVVVQELTHLLPILVVLESHLLPVMQRLLCLQLSVVTMTTAHAHIELRLGDRD